MTALPIILILGLIAAACNAAQDEIRFHWSRLFAHWFKPNSKTEQWFNPSKSWTNKYISNSKILTLLFSTVLVGFTDFWHFLKGVMINSIMVAVVIAAGFIGTILEWCVLMLLLNIIWGGIYEGVTRGIFGALSDKYMKTKK